MSATALTFNQRDKDVLAKGLQQLGLSLSQPQQDKCLQMLSELHVWGKVFNMTAIRAPQDMIVRHILDSVAVAPYLSGDRIIDVGTGAGFPGIPLAIARGDCSFYLLDSSQKKQVFVTHIIHLLQLSNAKAVHSSVEAYQVTPKFSTIITRAFAPLPEMIAATKHLLADGGLFLAMMGKSLDLNVIPSGYEMEALVPLQIPFGVGERHIALIKQSRTPS